MLTSHTANSHGRPPRQHPPQPLHFTLTVAVQRHRDLVIQLLDPLLHALLFHTDRHAAIIQHAPQIILERATLLRQALAQDLDFVGQMGELGGGGALGGAAGVADLGAEFGAGGAEEVGFVLDVGFGDEAGAGDVEVRGQEAADGFHEGDGLGLGEAARLEGGGHGVGVEVVDVGGCLQVRGFLLRRGGWVGGLAVEDGVEGFGGGFLGG